MKDKEVIKWQLVDKYYPYLVMKIQRIDNYLTFEEYEYAFKELSQIFFHIHQEIQNNEDLRDKHQIFLALIKKTQHKIKNYNLLQITSKAPSKIKMKQLTELKASLQSDVELMYMMIMEVITELNMFFPKAQKDMRLAIYK